MAKWYEGAEESAFKPVPGGYVAQLPRFIGRSQGYVVNETQKAEIAAVLRRQRLLMLYLFAMFVPVGAAFGLVAGIRHLTLGQVGLGMVALVTLVFVAVSVVQIGYVRPRLQPLLATLQPTDQRVTFREQVETVARKVSGKVLVAGIAGGILMIVGNIMTLADAIHDERALGPVLVWNAIPFLFGGVLTAYFAWLIVLRNGPDGNAA